MFEDATERAGIRFRHTSGETGKLRFIETFGGGCAFIDFDEDGFQDVLLLSNGTLGDDGRPTTPAPNLALYRNDRNGTFTDVTPEVGLDTSLGYMQALAVGDYDNDGHPDIFVAGYGRCALFHNTKSEPKTKSDPTTRRFESVTAQAGLLNNEKGPRWATGAAWGDYDNDGRLDLAVIHYANWSPATDKPCPRPDGTPSYCSPVIYPGESTRLFHNEGAGKFRDVSEATGISRVKGRALAACWLDYNGDGKQDLYIACDLDPNQLWKNEGGKFQEVGAEAGVAFGHDGHVSSGMGIAAGDYDHSGRQSLFVTNLPRELYSLFRNEGDMFTYATERAGLARITQAHSGWGTAFADIDRDGWADLVCANGNIHPVVLNDLAGQTYEDTVGLYRNRGDSTFEDYTPRGGAALRKKAGRGLAVGDYDNDGRIDILVMNRDDRPDLLHNVSADTNHWLTVDMQGVRSNRSGAGAKVTLVAGGVKQTQEVRLAGSYASSSDRRLLFGLGTASKIDRLEIAWPSGLRQTLRDLPIDRILKVREGAAIASQP